MFSWLKKHFIPHEGNQHRPHALRSSSVRSVAMLVIFLELFLFLLPTLTRINLTGGVATVLPAVLANLTNEERQEKNLNTLVVNPLLNKAAQMKAEDMASKSYFAHTSPEGKTPWYWIIQVGYKYQYAGENLAMNFSDSKDVTKAWMNSPTHKANIVKGSYTEFGTGVATGVYQGRQTIFVAQVYANPLPIVLAPAPTPKLPLKKVAQVPVPKKETKNVLGEEAESVISKDTGDAGTKEDIVKNTPVDSPTFTQNLLASPRNTTNVILYIIFGLISFALLLYIFIKMRNHHKDLITNGLVMLSIVGVVFVANYYVSTKSMTIADSFDYSVENK